jgi:hypothetical protein
VEVGDSLASNVSGKLHTGTITEAVKMVRSAALSPMASQRASGHHLAH